MFIRRALAVFIISWGGSALAQTTTPGAEPRTPPELAQPAAATEAREAEQTADIPQTPGETGQQLRPARDPNDPFIPVDDPMLVPPAPPPKVLTGWEEALKTVRTRSPDLNAAYAQIQVAQGRTRQTLARSLPTLVAQASGVHHLVLGPPGPTFTCPGVPIGANVPLPCPRGNVTGDLTLLVPLFAPRGWYDYGTAKEETRRVEYQAQDVERLVIGGLADAIVQVITTERLAEVTRVNLAAALSTVELNRKRARLGAASAVDVLRAEQEVATSRGQVVQADENLRQARERLGLALGYPEAWGVRPDISLDQLRADARNTCEQGDNIDERPDIKAAESSKKIAERNVRSVDWEFLPTLQGSSSAGYSYNDQATATRQHGTWTIGAVLTWNLYDGGLRYGEKRTNEALLEITRQDTLNARRTATIEVQQAFRGVEVSQQRLSIAENTRDIATDNARLARIKFINGTGSSFDMVQTQSAARQAQIDVTVREFELLRAQITAFLALASCDI